MFPPVLTPCILSFSLTHHFYAFYILVSSFLYNAFYDNYPAPYYSNTGQGFVKVRSKWLVQPLDMLLLSVYNYPPFTFCSLVPPSPGVLSIDDGYKNIPESIFVPQPLLPRATPVSSVSLSSPAV